MEVDEDEVKDWGRYARRWLLERKGGLSHTLRVVSFDDYMSSAAVPGSSAHL